LQEQRRFAGALGKEQQKEARQQETTTAIAAIEVEI
jgi:hypothetical protein